MASAAAFPTPVYERMVALRRDLHEHPELSWREERTARRIEEELRALGLEPRRVARTGVVADLPGQQDGPRVALRADTDALPVREETGLEFSSKHDGVMHACGHDGHSSLLYGAAQLLLEHGPLPVPVRLIWQPAEEKGTGARAMMDEGVLEGVGMIFGGHLDRHYSTGTLVVTEGPVNACTDMFSVQVQGQQGHGARPHETLDAVVVGSLLVTAIQTIVSREIDPSHPSVLSVGSFHAGSAPNVIAGEACLEGTIRATDDLVRRQLRRSIARIADAVGRLHGAKVEIALHPGTPPVINSPAMTQLGRSAAERVVGADAVIPLRTMNMGGEDFSHYLEEVEGCYIRFGAQVQGREGFPAHSSRFDFDEEALATGASWMAEVAKLAADRLAGRS